jgi:hypothetical protein
LHTGGVVWSDTISWHQTYGRRYSAPYLTWKISPIATGNDALIQQIDRHLTLNSDGTSASSVGQVGECGPRDPRSASPKKEMLANEKSKVLTGKVDANTL